ncbi:peptide chain release factor N(5)-glutamine methyltransferase [Methylopila turkensis]|uniref:Release factor glutamine methyltransferase n=1 Tax=Methylopila turkensis TaxID=1437816 RepID=A0A9W6JQY4_9HYPH|nr:peptide chain release factor N(5)-glutamine methyltransferase [Methylopila turkensis]GLK81632.1 release factor glutamine methyltransferase [Methylopila turkensis]
MTIGRALREAAARLAEARVDTPDLDARVLAGEAFGLDRAGMIARADAPAPQEAVAALAALVDRRLAGEPIARILGRREFWGLDLALAPATLTPRPDTETLVEEALQRAGPRDRALAIADLGTGTGCILLALLNERPNAFGVGVDRSAEAAAAARANAAALGLGARSAFLAGDWATALRGGFDLVVSNPPYITSAEIGGLDVEVRQHDPLAALDGGADGLDAYRAIVADLPRLLAPDGVAVLELGAGQENDVAALARAAGLAVLGPARRDLGGVPRALALGRVSP